MFLGFTGFAQTAKSVVLGKKSAPSTTVAVTNTSKSVYTKQSSKSSVKPAAKKQVVVKPVQGAHPGSDVAIGKDKQGRTLYQAPNGGLYFINLRGNREYVKKDN